MRSAFFSPRVLIPLLLCAAAAGLTSSGTLLALSQHELPGRVQRTLALQERVSYQRAIEEVYWRHRIWPKENSNPKPSLDAVMSDAQLEKKVKDYLRNSQALADYWQRPITAQQLQSEMDRMATHTKQSEVLQELFEALKNDPFVIAECLARPALAERLLRNWYGYDQRIHGELKQLAETELQARASVEQMKQLSGKYSEIEFIKSDKLQHEQAAKPGVRLTDREWNETMQGLVAAFGVRQHVAALKSADVSAHSKNTAEDYEALPVGKSSSLQEDESRYYATAILRKTADRIKLATVSWLKKPLQSWLTKAENQFSAAIVAPAGIYTLPTILGGGCTEDTWTATPGPPDARAAHTAVWTGSEMIVWGGLGPIYLDTGGRYNPSTDSWVATTTTNATARGFHTAVWTGNEMIVWGGVNDNSGVLNSGGRYNPTTDSWIPTTITNVPGARYSHTAVWTGSQMIVWGGWDGGGPYFNTGGRYNPNTDSWSATSMTNVPGPRQSHTAVWTGSEMIVWGGTADTTGGRYNPVTDSWTATSTTNAPDFRYYHTAVWTGSEMVVWGGENFDPLNTGGRYNPSTNSWTATSTANAPERRKNHTAVWAGGEMIVWGGRPENSFGELNTGGRYSPISNSWTPTTTVNAPSARTSHTAVWTGSEMIAWGGTAGLFSAVTFNTGGRYNPSADSWVNTGNNNAPLGRNSHTAVWTGSEMIVWGGDGEEFPALDTGGKYGPATDDWTATSTTDAPDGRRLHTGVWTGSEMIVWGGADENFLQLNTGGKYNPMSDSWTTTTTVNAPAGRYQHTAVWTGSEMIIWGGNGDSLFLNTGGRYDPGANSWAATSTSDAPGGRYGHTAVWTGSKMIVWGGVVNFDWSNTGGTYDSGTDSWMAISLTNAPAPRQSHTAVWTDSEMIVWGGYDGTTYFATGGKYNPEVDTWTDISTINAPNARGSHTAVWTGNEMIVWGGAGWGPTYFATGGKYNPEADTWTDTSTINAPGARDSHTAVWTDSEMIVWGGGPGALVSGGRYCAQGGPTPTPTPTPTPCTGRCSPTPRPRPTPLPRP